MYVCMYVCIYIFINLLSIHPPHLISSYLYTTPSLCLLYGTIHPTIFPVFVEGISNSVTKIQETYSQIKTKQAG